jgi:hypothetical protein
VSEKEMKKIADKIGELWGAIESIAASIDDRELQRDLQDASEALFKFAANVLRSKGLLDNAELSIHSRSDGEIAIEASFNGIHLHTEFLQPDDTIDTVIQRFSNPDIAIKSALALLAWALRDSAQAIMEWHVKHF